MMNIFQESIVVPQLCSWIDEWAFLPRNKARKSKMARSLKTVRRTFAGLGNCTVLLSATLAKGFMTPDIFCKNHLLFHNFDLLYLVVFLLFEFLLDPFAYCTGTK